MPRRPYTLGRCESCGSNRLLKYAKRTHCCRYLCQKAATALIAAAEEDAAEADTPNFLKEIKFILGQRFCDPEELNGEKLRNTLSSSDITRCFQIDGIFAASDSDDGFREKRWVEIEELVVKIPKRPRQRSEEVEGEGSGGYREGDDAPDACRGVRRRDRSIASPCFCGKLSGHVLI